MAETQTDPSVGNESDKGKGGGAGNPPELEHALKDVHKYKGKLRETETRLKELEDKLKNRETEELEKNQEFKKLYETEKKAREENELKIKKLNESFVNHHKFTTVKSLAEKKGLRAEAAADLEMIDLGEVVVETTNTGKFSIVGADDFVERLSQKKPHWFTDPAAPNINVTTPGVVNGAKLTVKDINDAKAKYEKSKAQADLKDWQDKSLRFKQQKK